MLCSGLRNRSQEFHGCTVCLKRFTTASGASVHARSHTGEKPFGCTFCKKKFSQSGHAKVGSTLVVVVVVVVVGCVNVSCNSKCLSLYFSDLR